MSEPISLNKFFKYIDNIATFNTLKVSNNENDTEYVIGDGAPIFGTPEVLWENICFIEQERLIWTHGAFYNQDSYDPFTDEEILAMIPEDEEILDLIIVE